MKAVSIIGPGRLGGALAIALDRRGFVVDSLIYRSAEAARSVRDAMTSNTPVLIPFESLDVVKSQVVIIASGDPEISAISKALVKHVRSGATILHTSGSLSSDVLLPLKTAGCRTGSMHPLISVSDPFIGSRRFAGAYFCIEGDSRAAKSAASIAEALGGTPFSIDTQFKPLYHAAAVSASGHLITLLDTAIEMLSACGIDFDSAKRILMPLIISSIDNLRTQTPAEALTGTFARVDIEAFDRHLSALASSVSRETAAVYLAIAERSLSLAERRGADAGRAAEIRNRISIAKRNFE